MKLTATNAQVQRWVDMGLVRLGPEVRRRRRQKRRASNRPRSELDKLLTKAAYMVDYRARNPEYANKERQRAHDRYWRLKNENAA